MRSIIRNDKFRNELKRINEKTSISPSILKECNKNKFFGEYEQIVNINSMFFSILECINDWEKKKEENKKSKSLKKLVKLVDDFKNWEKDEKAGSDQLFYCLLEIKAIIDFGSCLHDMCYGAEGDGLSVLKVYDKINVVKKFIEKKELPII